MELEPGEKNIAAVEMTFVKCLKKIIISTFLNVSPYIVLDLMHILFYRYDFAFFPYMFSILFQISYSSQQLQLDIFSVLSCDSFSLSLCN